VNPLTVCSPAEILGMSSEHPEAVSVMGTHVPQDSRLSCVRWDGAYPLSTRYGEALLLKCGINAVTLSRPAEAKPSALSVMRFPRQTTLIGCLAPRHR
jgi:hypothetical protein